MEKPLSDGALIHNANHNVRAAQNILFDCWPPAKGKVQTGKLEQVKALLEKLDQEPVSSSPRVAWHLVSMARAWVALVLDGFISYPQARPKIERLLRLGLDHLQDHIQAQ